MNVAKAQVQLAMAGLQAVHRRAAAKRGKTPEQLLASELRRSLAKPAEKRDFPKNAAALKSTHAYVHAYYWLNKLLQLDRNGVDALFAPLSEAPTAWLNGPEVVEETVGPEFDISDIA